jgi:multiple sugar transport system ATP-binding protein
VLVGMRPEDVKPLEPGEPAGEGKVALGGEVALVETLGHEVLVHIALPGGETLIAKSYNHAHLPRIGDLVRAAATLERLHLFDAATKTRLPEELAQ